MIARIFAGGKHDDGSELVGCALVASPTEKVANTHWFYIQYNAWTPAERECVEKVLSLSMTPTTRAHYWIFSKQEVEGGYEYIAELNDRRGVTWKPVIAYSAQELASGIAASYRVQDFPQG